MKKQTIYVFPRLTAVYLIAMFIAACSSWPSPGKGGVAELDATKSFYFDQVDFAQEQGQLQNQLNIMSIRIDNLSLRGAKYCLPARLKLVIEYYTRAYREVDAQMLDDASDSLVMVHHKLNQLEQRLNKVQRITGCSIKTSENRLMLSLLENLLNTENSFDTDSSQLNVGYQRKLKTVADYLVKHVDIDIHIIGHTDATGSEQYNKKLSKNRAVAVKTILLDYGVSENRLKVQSDASINPLHENIDVAGRLANRRINIELIPVKPDFFRLLRDWDHDNK